MAVKYTKLFTATDAIDLDPVTILVEYVSNGSGYRAVAIKTLGGEYDSPREFEEALDTALEEADGDVVWNFIPLHLDGVKQLIGALIGAVEAAEEDEA